jgi:3-oxoacyl-[acyl-carrier-protein] synthase-3
MTRSPAFLTAPHYVLGEIAEEHTAISGLSARIAELKILPTADFWGWGNIRRTERSIESMAIETGTATLCAAGVDPASVDALVLCSTRFPEETESHGRLVETIMTGIGLDGADFVGLTLHRCANLLAAIKAAETMVAADRHRCVLVITTDRMAGEAKRMEKFALFSDGAASCVVMSGEGRGDATFEVAGCAAAHNIRALDWSNEIDSTLSQRVNKRLLTPLNMKLDDVSGLLHANIFRPIVMLKEMQAGFTPEQLETANIPRVGHCFAADPLINLVDRHEAGELRENHYYMLASSVPGSRIGILLRKVADRP